MKTAIVFGGGGSKGSYQLGVWRALREMNLEFDIATGTSIGSINACLYAMEAFDMCEKLWSSTTVDKVMKNGFNLNQGIDYYIENFDTLLPFIKNYIAYRGADISPFKERLREYCDERRFFNSHIDFALMATEFPTRAPVLKTKASIAPGTLGKWLLASASCFPAFPVCEIDGNRYIDGGYCDNLPIDAAFSLGAEEVVAIPLKPLEKIRHSKNPLIKFIKPSRDLGSFLCFEPDVLSNNAKLGYLDAMKAYGKLFGRRFAFSIGDAVWADKLAHIVLRDLEIFERNVDSYRTAKVEPYPLSLAIAGSFGDMDSPLSGLLAIMEAAMDMLEFSPYKVYALDDALVSLFARSQDSQVDKLRRTLRDQDANKQRLTKEENPLMLASALMLNSAAYILHE